MEAQFMLLKPLPKVTVAVALGFIVLVLSLLAYLFLPSILPTGTAHQPKTFQGLGNRVQLDAPPDAQIDHPKVEITDGMEPAQRGAYSLIPHAVAFGQPVEIKVTHGQLAPNKVKVTLRLPHGLPRDAYAKAYVAVYEPALGRYIPLLDSVADPEHHTVSALAPHFSTYQSFVNAAQRVTGHIIDIGEALTLQWLDLIPPIRQFVKDVQTDMVNNFFGWGPDAVCKPNSANIDVDVKDELWGNTFDACAEDYTDKSGRKHIRLANHWSFPMSIHTPAGYTVDPEDFDYDRGTLPELAAFIGALQNGNTLAPGPGVAQLALLPDAQLPNKLRGQFEWAPMAFDAAMFAATIITKKPATTVSKAAMKQLGKAMVELSAKGVAGADLARLALAKVAAYGPEMAVNLEAAQRVVSALGCVQTNIAKWPILKKGQFFDDWNEKVTAAFHVGWDCIKIVAMEKASSIAQLLDGIASQIGIVPELLQAKMAKEIKRLSGRDVTEVEFTVHKTIQDTDQDGHRLPPELLAKVRAVHDAAKGHHYKALGQLMHDPFISESRAVPPSAITASWNWGGGAFDDELDALVKLLETSPYDLGDHAYSYRKGFRTTGFIHTDRWAYYDFNDYSNAVSTEETAFRSSANLICEPLTRIIQSQGTPSTEDPHEVAAWTKLAVSSEQHVLGHLRQIKPPANEAHALSALYDQIDREIGQMAPLLPKFAANTATDADWEKAKRLQTKLNTSNYAMSETHQLGYCTVPGWN
jgi:hypothetical protein